MNIVFDLDGIVFGLGDIGFPRPDVYSVKFNYIHAVIFPEHAGCINCIFDHYIKYSSYFLKYRQIEQIINFAC